MLCIARYVASLLLLSLLFAPTAEAREESPDGTVGDSKEADGAGEENEPPSPNPPKDSKQTDKTGDAKDNEATDKEDVVDATTSPPQDQEEGEAPTDESVGADPDTEAVEAGAAELEEPGEDEGNDAPSQDDSDQDAKNEGVPKPGPADADDSEDVSTETTSDDPAEEAEDATDAGRDKDGSQTATGKTEAAEANQAGAVDDTSDDPSRPDAAASEAPDNEEGEAAADTPSPTAAATAAQAVHTEHCADVAALDNSTAARAVHTVSATWLQVSDAYKASPEPYLLYWRGVLGACLGQEDRALEDLKAFVDQSSDEGAYSGMIREARRRVRRLERQPGTAAANDLGARKIRAQRVLGNGIGLALVSAASGVGAGVLWTQARKLGTQLETGVRARATLTEMQIAGEVMNWSSRVLTGLSIGCGLASTIAMVASIGTLAKVQRESRKTASRAATSIPITPWLSPGSQGLVGGIEGRW